MCSPYSREEGEFWVALRNLNHASGSHVHNRRNAPAHKPHRCPFDTFFPSMEESAVPTLSLAVTKSSQKQSWSNPGGCLRTRRKICPALSMCHNISYFSLDHLIFAAHDLIITALTSESELWHSACQLFFKDIGVRDLSAWGTTPHLPPGKLQPSRKLSNFSPSGDSLSMSTSELSISAVSHPSVILALFSLSIAITRPAGHVPLPHNISKTLQVFVCLIIILSMPPWTHLTRGTVQLIPKQHQPHPISDLPFIPSIHLTTFSEA